MGNAEELPEGFILAFQLQHRPTGSPSGPFPSVALPAGLGVGCALTSVACGSVPVLVSGNLWTHAPRPHLPAIHTPLPPRAHASVCLLLLVPLCPWPPRAYSFLPGAAQVWNFPIQSEAEWRGFMCLATGGGLSWWGCSSDKCRCYSCPFGIKRDGAQS